MEPSGSRGYTGQIHQGPWRCPPSAQSQKLATHTPFMQCAADSTKLGAIRVAPQKWPPRRCRDTMKGQAWGRADRPPTISEASAGPGNAEPGAGVRGCWLPAAPGTPTLSQGLTHPAPTSQPTPRDPGKKEGQEALLTGQQQAQQGCSQHCVGLGCVWGDPPWSLYSPPRREAVGLPHGLQGPHFLPVPRMGHKAGAEKGSPGRVGTDRATVSGESSRQHG